MNDTSNLVALYSALIQGGATLLAILGAFLLAVGPARRAGWASALRESERWERERDRHLDEFNRVRAASDAVRESDAFRRIGEGKIDQEEAKTLLEAQERVGEDIAALEAASKILVEEGERTRTMFASQVEATKDFFLASQVLLVLMVFCVIMPAFLLAFLHRDTNPFGRSALAVSVYANALLFVGVVMSEIGYGRDENLAEDEKNAPKLRWWSNLARIRRMWFSDLARIRRIILAILIGSTIVMLAVGNVPGPRELWGSVRGGGTPAASTPSGGTPVVVK